VLLALGLISCDQKNGNDSSDSTILEPYTISTIEETGDVGYHSSIKIDNTNKVHISYYDRTNGSVKYALKNAQSWQITTVDIVGTIGASTIYSQMSTSLGLDQMGNAHIAYVDLNSYSLKYATNSTGTWALITIDDSSAVRDVVSLAVDKNNHAHISYIDDTVYMPGPDRPLNYATNITGSWVISEIDYYATFSTAIGVDKNCNTHIIYIKDNENLYYTTNDSGSWLTTKVESTGITTRAFPSLSLDSYGKSHVSFYDFNRGDLKYATNAGGYWITSTVEAIEFLESGIHNAITVDPFDGVHICYRVDGVCDFGNCNCLKYTKKIPGEWVSSYVDKSYEVGIQPSITADLNGKIHISYYDYTNGNLKYATNSKD